LDWFVNGGWQRVAAAVSIFVAAVIVAQVAAYLVRRAGRRRAVVEHRVFRLLAGSVNVAVILVGLISALGTLGVNVAALVASLGLTGLAVGLALKDAISNLIAGLLIVLYKPFDLGDVLEVAGSRGKVADINMRYVTLETEEGHVLVPNQNFLTMVVKRRDRTENRKVGGKE